MNKRNWSNLDGVSTGLDSEALSLDPSAVLRMAKYLKKVRKQGFYYKFESNLAVDKIRLNSPLRINRGYIFYIKNKLIKFIKWIRNY
jgi:hypothetical protein